MFKAVQALLLASVATASVPLYAQSLDTDAARRIVAPFYDALNQPATKDVEALLARATSADWQSCGSNAACAPRDVVINAFKRRGADVPDLRWDIVDVLIAAPNTVVVRSEGSGTPVRDFLGQPAKGKSFRIMAIDVHTIHDGRIARSYHVEDWAGAIRQLSGKP